MLEGRKPRECVAAVAACGPTDAVHFGLLFEEVGEKQRPVLRDACAPC